MPAVRRRLLVAGLAVLAGLRLAVAAIVIASAARVGLAVAAVVSVSAVSLRLAVPMVVTLVARLALRITTVFPLGIRVTTTEQRADTTNDPPEAALRLTRVLATAATTVTTNDTRERARDGFHGGPRHLVSHLILPVLGLAELLAHLELPDAAVAVAGIMDTFLVVLRVLDTLPRQLVSVFILPAAASLTPPLLDSAEEKFPSFVGPITAIASLGGVVKDTAGDAVDRPVDIHALVVDGVHDLRYDPSNRVGRAPTGNLVQDLDAISE